MKTLKLPLKLTIALGQYFLNYQLHQKQCISSRQHWKDGKLLSSSEEWANGRPWDKQADISEIEKQTPKNWSWEATAGTFFLHRKGCKNTFVISNQKWPLARVLKPGESFLS